MRRVPPLLLTGLLLLPAALAAQNSVYGIRGLGLPGRALTPRAIAMGGGLGAFEPLSPINPAGVAAFPQTTVLAMSSTSFRGYRVGDVAVDGLRATRFPLVLLGGRFGALPLGFSLGFTSYAERSYDVTRTDTLTLRGVPVVVTDHDIANGGVSDLRGAVGWRATSHLHIGAALHLITGSTKLNLTREFADSAYRTYRSSAEEAVEGIGASAGVVWAPLPTVQLALAGRVDGAADVTVDSTPAGTMHLPVSLTAGLQLMPQRALRWATTFIWRSWSRADNDLAVRAFDTWEVGTGVELGGAESGTSRVPLRLGFRYAMLPFAPGADQAHEIDVALGSGVAFAGNRGLLDVALERVMRDGAGASERAWQLTFSLTVRP